MKYRNPISCPLHRLLVTTLQWAESLSPQSLKWDSISEAGACERYPGASWVISSICGCTNVLSSSRVDLPQGPTIEALPGTSMLYNWKLSSLKVPSTADLLFSDKVREKFMKVLFANWDSFVFISFVAQLDDFVNHKLARRCVIESWTKEWRSSASLSIFTWEAWPAYCSLSLQPYLTSFLFRIWCHQAERWCLT